jgi:sugar phosphate isomerase/epimerase
MDAPDTKIGVTLFNLRDYCNTAEELDATLAKVKKIGYEAVQISGVGLEPEVIRKKLDKYGLFPCASHENFNQLRDDFDGVVKKLKTLGCDFTALGSPGGFFSLNKEEATKLFAELDEFGRRFAAEGIRFGYHNHHIEFAQTDWGKLWLESLYEETNSDTFFAEIDVHWIQRGGQNPPDWIRRVAGRMPVCHFKDFTIVGDEARFCEIGEGNLNWPEIIKACEETGVRWYVVEQDRTFGEKDIFESIEISYNNMKKMGIK